MSTIPPSDLAIFKYYTESPPPSNKYSGKKIMSNADFAKFLSKEVYNARKMEQQRQGRKAMQMNQNQSVKFQDISSGHDKDHMLNPSYDEIRNDTKESTINEMGETERRSRWTREQSDDSPTLRKLLYTDVIIKEMEEQEKNTKSASSAWIPDAVPTKRSSKKHQEKDVKYAMAPKATKDRHHTRRNVRDPAEFKSLEALIVSRKNPKPEDSDVESDKGDQQFGTFVKNSTPALSEIKASFQATRDKATTTIKNSQTARAEATRVILESQAVRTRIEKALIKRHVDKCHAEIAESAGLSRGTSTKTVIASSVDGSVEDILEMDKNNNKKIAKEAVQEAVQSAEQAVQKALQFQDTKVQLSAGSPQTSNSPTNSPTNTMESNAKNTNGAAATKVSKYTGCMDDYKIEFVTEAEDDAENDAENGDADEDWVKVMDYDEDENEVEEDGWLLA
ncbi:uncharacterized protein EAF02_008016 [Botrytis sinoallii]|uniref:uncharacterized protein n=1 Tax=Botrytis sinoallii TaxID=1463999 RepID=UPI0019022494|nr:uncharacterized protein EAF02_008016 [Botrytis sinoallii]KAF7879846.1 hypothetical protein EAF02_008016 [Botrytis sinoallii]